MFRNPEIQTLFDRKLIFLSELKVILDLISFYTVKMESEKFRQ